jgi:hypothetical protein
MTRLPIPPQRPPRQPDGTEKPGESLRTPERYVIDKLYTCNKFSGHSLGFSGSSLGFSDTMKREIDNLIPSYAVRLHGKWTGQPPRGSAEEVIFRIARLAKFSKEQPQALQVFVESIARYVSDRLNVDDDDTYRILVHGFNKAKVSPDESLLVEVKQKAEELMRSTASAYRDTRRHLLYCICEVLGRSGEFYLSTRDAGRLIGADRKLAGQWLNAMVADGHLEMTLKHTEFKATRYVWLR